MYPPWRTVATQTAWLAQIPVVLTVAVTGRSDLAVWLVAGAIGGTLVWTGCRRWWGPGPARMRATGMLLLTAAVFAGAELGPLLAVIVALAVLPAVRRYDARDSRTIWVDADYLWRHVARAACTLVGGIGFVYALSHSHPVSASTSIAEAVAAALGLGLAWVVAPLIGSYRTIGDRTDALLALGLSVSVATGVVAASWATGNQSVAHAGCALAAALLLSLVARSIAPTPSWLYERFRAAPARELIRYLDRAGRGADTRFRAELRARKRVRALPHGGDAARAAAACRAVAAHHRRSVAIGDAMDVPAALRETHAVLIDGLVVLADSYDALADDIGAHTAPTAVAVDPETYRRILENDRVWIATIVALAAERQVALPRWFRRSRGLFELLPNPGSGETSPGM